MAFTHSHAVFPRPNASCSTAFMEPSAFSPVLPYRFPASAAPPLGRVNLPKLLPDLGGGYEKKAFTLPVMVGAEGGRPGGSSAAGGSRLQETGELFGSAAASEVVVVEDFEEEPRVELLDKGLWERFHRVGNEMIITRAGRRLFPTFKVKITGLNKRAQYILVLDLVSVGDYRYKYDNAQWLKAGLADVGRANRVYVHPSSPCTGAEWMQKDVSFHKVKLSNGSSGRNEVMTLNSMHKYQPRVHIVAGGNMLKAPYSSLRTFQFPETRFYAVTAYQNETIIQMKIDHNPYAKAFRERATGSREKTKRVSPISPCPPSKDSDDLTVNDDAEDQDGSPRLFIAETAEVTTRTQKPMTAGADVSGSRANRQETSDCLMKDTVPADSAWPGYRGESSDSKHQQRLLRLQKYRGVGTTKTTTTTTMRKTKAAKCPETGLSQEKKVKTQNCSDRCAETDLDTETRSERETDVNAPTDREKKMDNAAGAERKTGTASRKRKTPPVDEKSKVSHDRRMKKKRESLDNRSRVDINQKRQVDASHAPAGSISCCCCSDSNSSSIMSQPASVFSTPALTSSIPQLVHFQEVDRPAVYQHRPTAGRGPQKVAFPDLRKAATLGDGCQPIPAEPCKQRISREDMYRNFALANLPNYRPPLGSAFKASVPAGIWKDRQYPFTEISSPTSGTSAGVSPNGSALKIYDTAEVSKRGTYIASLGSPQEVGNAAIGGRNTPAPRTDSIRNFTAPSLFGPQAKFPYLNAAQHHPALVPSYPFPYLYWPLTLRWASSAGLLPRFPAPFSSMSSARSPPSFSHCCTDWRVDN